MTDKELIKEVMKIKEWNQAQVARYLEVDRSLVTRVLKYDQALHPSYRKLLMMLIEGHSE